MEGVGKMEMNNVLMWHFFDLPRVLHPAQNWRKLKNFEREGIRTHPLHIHLDRW